MATGDKLVTLDVLKVSQDFLNNKVVDLKNEITEFEDTGKGLLTRGDFRRGQYNPQTDQEMPQYTYRIASRKAMTFKTAIVLTVADGYRIYPWMYASNGWTTAGWKTQPFNVPANTPLMVYIARVTEDTSEVADIAQFLQAVTVTFARSGNGFNTLTVGSGKQYATIQSAVTAAKDGDYVIVYPGTYNESVQCVDKKYVSIIGVDRDQCILTYSGWDYNNPTLNIGRGTIKNLTLRSTNTGTETDHTAYSLHIDTGSSIGTQDAPQSFYAENCRFIGDVRQPVGIGLKRYFTCTFVNCEFIQTSGYPAFYAHSWEVSEGVTNLVKQRLVLKNCLFMNGSTSGNPTIQLQSQEWPNTDAEVLFHDCVVVNTSGGQTIGMHLYRDNGGAKDKYLGSSDWTLSPLSFGNNVQGMNA